MIEASKKDCRRCLLASQSVEEEEEEEVVVSSEKKCGAQVRDRDLQYGEYLGEVEMSEIRLSPSSR